MRIYKLLFLLAAFVGFHSCAEYVYVGTDDGFVDPEFVFKAEVADTGAKYVGESFEFKATLNSADVTENTEFRVNGVTINGNIYHPTRAGEQRVVATMDEFTDTFVFNVLEEGEEPEEPADNRIEYNGESYPVTKTIWILQTRRNSTTGEIEPIIHQNIGPNNEEATRWTFQSIDKETLGVADNGFHIQFYVPVDQNGEPQAPHEAETFYSSTGGALLKINGSVLDTFNPAISGPLDEGYPILNFISKSASSANYTIEVKKDEDAAKLFWNGSYTVENSVN